MLGAVVVNPLGEAPLSLPRTHRTRNTMMPTMPNMIRTAAVAVAFAAGAGLHTSADTLSPLWSIAPDERPYVTTGNTERGLAHNPATGNVLLLSRAGSPRVYVLQGSDGSDRSEELGEPLALSTFDENGENPIAGGTFSLNLVGAGSDGAIYACNLATSLGTVRIYRWADEQPETPVSIAFSGDPLEGIAEPGSGQDIRFGDNFAVHGSGASTQLLQTSRNGKYIILYSTTDGTTFTPTVITSPADVIGKIGLGLAFGSDDTFWAKVSGNALLRIRLQTTGGTPSAQLLDTISTSIVGIGATGIGYDPATRRLGAIDYAAHSLSVFDATDPAGLVPIGDPVPFPSANPNVNGTGAVAFGPDAVFALDSNNGILALEIEESVVVEPPSITSNPTGGVVYEGASFSMAVAAQGTPPFTYQWFLNETNAIPGATGAQLVLTNLTAAQAGAYTVTVSNAANVVVTSSPANLTVRVPAASGILKPAWSLNPGDRPYLTTDNTQRGLAFNPASGNLLVASRSPANTIAVLDAATGAHKHNLRTTTAEDVPVFQGGTLPLNMIGVSDDGVVYAANLVTDASTAAFQIYRWDNDSPDTIPVATTLSGDLTIPERWGDTLDVRGQGPSTQILIGSRGLAPQEGRRFAVLSTTDGYDFSAQVFDVTDAAGPAFGLGIAFGTGNTVLGTANGQPLVRVTFNPDTGTAALERTYAPTEIPVAVSFIASLPSSNWVAGVALENPDNIQLFDLSGESPTLADQQLILPEQPNANGTGAADFGGNRLFVLNTNHGLRAYDITAGSPPAEPARLVQPRVVSGAFTFDLTGTAGRDYTVQKSADLQGWSDVGTFQPPATVSDPAAPGPVFYRAVVR